MKSFIESLPNVPRKERRSTLLQAIQECTSETDATNLIRGVARLGRKWERLVVEVLDDLLADTSHPHGDLLRRESESFLERTLVLRERDTGSKLHEIRGVLERLEHIPKCPPPVLSIEFDTPHEYVYGLCAIAAWASERARSVRFESRYPRVEYFLQRGGVVEAITNRASDPVKFDTDTILGFTRIDPETRFQTDAHAGRLVQLFRNHMVLERTTAEALSITFAELIENAVKHGEIQSSAWLFANYHPQPKVMHVCICDRGVGVRETFERSSTARLRELAKHPTAWLREATEPLVTSKSEGHAGYGLFLARELRRRNGGVSTIVSGSAGYTLHPRSTESVVADIEETQAYFRPWKGTLVAIQFRLDRPLQLGPVYEHLPAPEYEDAGSDDYRIFDD